MTEENTVHIYGTENTFLILIYERGCSAQCGHQITQQIYTINFLKSFFKLPVYKL